MNLDPGGGGALKDLTIHDVQPISDELTTWIQAAALDNQDPGGGGALEILLRDRTLI